jgi:hypothetical protein
MRFVCLFVLFLGCCKIGCFYSVTTVTMNDKHHTQETRAALGAEAKTPCAVGGGMKKKEFEKSRKQQNLSNMMIERELHPTCR